MADQIGTASAGLRKDAIGLREALFQGITDMAPGAAIAASIPAGAALAGGSLPLSVVFALIACLLTAPGIAELARNLPAAGSLATYAAQGLHQAVGFLVARGYVLVGVLISPLVLLQLGFTTAATLNGEWSAYPADLWWPWTVLGALIVMAAGLYGLFWVLVFLAIVNSTVANANAGVNVSTRTSYAMGRIGVFPYALARLGLRHRAPYVSVLAVTAATVAVALGLGFAYTPTAAFGMVGTGIVILLVAIYIIANITCIAYFLRRRRDEFNVLLHLVIPVLGAAAFVPAWLTAAGLPAFSFITRLTPPASYAGPAVGVWMVLGVAYLVWLYVRHPARVAEVARVHLDDAGGVAGTKPASPADLVSPS